MATLRSAKQAGREAEEIRGAPRERGAGAARTGDRAATRGEGPRQGTREWLVARARQRVESGFYEDPLILDAAIYGIIASARQSGGKAGNSSGV